MSFSVNIIYLFIIKLESLSEMELVDSLKQKHLQTHTNKITTSPYERFFHYFTLKWIPLMMQNVIFMQNIKSQVHML